MVTVHPLLERRVSSIVWEKRLSHLDEGSEAAGRNGCNPSNRAFWIDGVLGEEGPGGEGGTGSNGQASSM